MPSLTQGPGRSRNKGAPRRWPKDLASTVMGGPTARRTEPPRTLRLQWHRGAKVPCSDSTASPANSTVLAWRFMAWKERCGTSSRRSTGPSLAPSAFAIAVAFVFALSTALIRAFAWIACRSEDVVGGNGDTPQHGIGHQPYHGSPRDLNRAFSRQRRCCKDHGGHEE